MNLLSGLTYKQKKLGLGCGVVVLLLVGYKISIKETLKIREEVRGKVAEKEWITSKSKELLLIKKKIDHFESTFQGREDTEVRDVLGRFISKRADKGNCIVTEIPGIENYKVGNLAAQINRFTLEGSFKSLLILLNDLENEKEMGIKILSARFYVKQDPDTKRKRLSLTIVAQSFEEEKS